MNTDALPPGWEKTTLGELLTSSQNGFGTRRQTSGTPTVVLRLADIHEQVIDLADPRRINATTEEIAKYRASEDDLLAIRVNGSPALVGRLIRVGEFSEPLLFCDHFIRLNLSCREVCPFLRFFGDSKQFRRFIELNMVSSAGQCTVNQTTLASIPIELPPLAEQRRIVAKVEELFAELDAAVEELERVRANLKRYRAAVLKAAVTGDLTADWRAKHPSAEPASVLLDRIFTDRRAKWETDQWAKFAAANKSPPKDWQAKYAEPSKTDMGDLPKLPVAWCWATVEQVGMVQLGRQRSPGNASRNFPTKYIRAANITEAGLDLSDVLEMEFSPRERITFTLRAGDLILSEASGSPEQVGKPAIWRDELAGCCFQNTVIRLRPELASSEFLLVVFQQFYRGKVFARIAGGVGINHLSASKFSTIPVPLAPLAEQEVIALEVEARLSDVTAAEAVVNANLTRAARLRQSILKEAFAGRLVKQDPADEPASALLERIRTAKPTTPVKKTRGRQPVIEVNEVFVDVLAFAVPTATEAGPLNRTKIQKFAAVLQTHLGIEIVERFLQAPYGPYAPELEAMEPICGERSYFTIQKQPKGKDGFEVLYTPGENAEVGRAAGVKRLGKKAADAEKLLRLIRTMTTDEAELFATVYAVWNDLLLDGKVTEVDAIVAGVYAWNVKKRKFAPAVIAATIAQIRADGYTPTGRGKRTEPVIKRGRKLRATSKAD